MSGRPELRLPTQGGGSYELYLDGKLQLSYIDRQNAENAFRVIDSAYALGAQHKQNQIRSVAETLLGEYVRKLVREELEILLPPRSS